MKSLKELKKISNGSRLTIPKEICIKLGIEAGSHVLVRWKPEDDKLHMVLTPAEVKIKPRSKI